MIFVNRFDLHLSLWSILVLSAVKMNRVQAGSSTCVTFPNDTSSCSELLQCPGELRLYSNVTYDSFAFNGHPQPTTNEFATCRVAEACSGTGSCDIVEMVLTELEPSICPEMCYHMSVPHYSCNDPISDEIRTSVFVVNLVQEDNAILITRYTSSAHVESINVTSSCQVMTTDKAEIKECRISIDSSCPGTTVTSFEPGTDARQLEVYSVSGEEIVHVTLDAPSFNDDTLTVLATVFSPAEADKEVNLVGDDKSKIVELASIVLDIVLVDEIGNLIELADGELISLTFASPKTNGYEERRCSFYVENDEKWSYRGCWTSASNDTTVTCTCNHLTSFAVLLQFEDCSITGTNLYLQTLLTRFLNAISIGALLLTVVVFVFLKLYTSDQVKVHISLAISLGLTQILMLFMDQTHNPKLCTAIAATLHYLLSVYCVTMLQEGILLHSRASKTHHAPVKGWILILTAWGIPVVLVAVLVGSIPQGYGSACVCWLSIQEWTMWIFLAEIATVVLINTVFLYLIMRTFVSLKANTKKSDTDKLKATARAVLIMVPMLGMTWIFGVLQAFSKNIFMQYLFIIINALQGPLFFMFQCMLHHEVQKVLNRKRSKIGDSSKWAMSTSSSGGTMTTEKGVSQTDESKFGK